jgi:hypothetical protein
MSRLPISSIEISPNEKMVELSKQILKTSVFSFPKKQQRYDMTVPSIASHAWASRAVRLA